MLLKSFEDMKQISLQQKPEHFFGDFCSHDIKTWPNLLKFQSISIFAISSNKRKETVSMPKYSLK